MQTEIAPIKIKISDTPKSTDLRLLSQQPQTKIRSGDRKLSFIELYKDKNDNNCNQADNNCHCLLEKLESHLNNILNINKKISIFTVLHVFCRGLFIVI